MNDDLLRQTIADILGVSVEELTDDTPVTPEAWDSVDLLQLIAALDEVRGSSVPVNAINQSTTAGELLSLAASA